MKNYYAPDSRWDMYRVNDKEEFIERLVIKGHFHNQVPEDVLKAYETIEYLMAHSYYHWPLYDEAFHKVLLTIEMGIKLKAKQLNIPTYRRKENGEKWYRKLSDLIDDICEKDYLSDLKKKLDRSRGLRNLQAHPKQNSFSGAMGGIPRNIKFCVNVLNRLFRNKGWHKKQQEQFAKAKNMIANFDDKLLVIENDGKGELISSVLDFETVEDALFLVCLPVLNVKKLKTDDKEGVLPEPITFTFDNYQFYENRIVGETLKESKIEAFVTESEDLAGPFDKYKKYLQNNTVQDKRIYTDFMTTEVPWHLSNAEYKYFANLKR